MCRFLRLDEVVFRDLEWIQSLLVLVLRVTVDAAFGFNTLCELVHVYGGIVYASNELSWSRLPGFPGQNRSS
jgi:hypothetical protein